jgi:hypothetical protein
MPTDWADVRHRRPPGQMKARGIESVLTGDSTYSKTLRGDVTHCTAVTIDLACGGPSVGGYHLAGLCPNGLSVTRVVACPRRTPGAHSLNQTPHCLGSLTVAPRRLGAYICGRVCSTCTAFAGQHVATDFTSTSGIAAYLRGITAAELAALAALTSGAVQSSGTPPTPAACLLGLPLKKRIELAWRAHDRVHCATLCGVGEPPELSGFLAGYTRGFMFLTLEAMSAAGP